MYKYESRVWECDSCGKQIANNEVYPGWIQIQQDGLDEFKINYTSIDNRGKIHVKEIRDLCELDFCCPECFWNYCKDHI